MLTNSFICKENALKQVCPIGDTIKLNKLTAFTSMIKSQLELATSLHKDDWTLLQALHSLSNKKALSSNGKLTSLRDDLLHLRQLAEQDTNIHMSPHPYSIGLRYGNVQSGAGHSKTRHCLWSSPPGNRQLCRLMAARGTLRFLSTGYAVGCNQKNRYSGYGRLPTWHPCNHEEADTGMMVHALMPWNVVWRILIRTVIRCCHPYVGLPIDGGVPE
ncbi:hypothetical protein Hamer_G027807 [Homarus americanus]|uniref:Uncharacterized protein n=1 Tax=Homarus americanus TaxID=6706 RepID=A0A8J5N3G4_HOMAM|nr:hypothetical protein Hamer_G027807 [Homarus americanus]